MAFNKKNSLPSFRIILVFVCITLMGIFLLPRLPVKLVPDKLMPSLTISFSMRNATARVVEAEVSSKLESMLGRVKGVSKVYSSSGSGWGSITVELNKHADIEKVRFEIATLIRQVYPSLPKEVSYPSLSTMRSEDESATPFLTYTLNAPSSPLQIQQFAERVIKQQLSDVNGIEKVDISGATGMVWQLVYDYEQLNQLGLTVGNIQTAIQNHLKRENLGMGLMETGSGTSRWIRLALSPAQLPGCFDASKIVVKNQLGKLIRLSELVEVSYIEDTPSSHFRINGLNSIYLSITAKNDANQLKLAKEVTKKLETMASQFPPNYKMFLTYDATQYIRDQLRKILLRSGMTILILLSFVLLVYRNLKYLLMVTASLTGSLFLAVILYYLLNLEMHLYSLMGITISLSLMLDNIIVMADQIHRQKNRKAFLAIFTASVTTIAALVMIFFMEEKIRLNLQDFALVILINLGVSLVVVLWLVPALMNSLRIDDLQKKQRITRLRRKVRFIRVYRNLLIMLSRRRWWVLTFGVLLFGLPVFLLPSSLISEEQQFSDKPITQSLPVRCYNATLGSSFYQQKLKPILDIALGGTLRLFVQKVYQGSYWKENEETTINITLSMPNGTTLDQTDHLIGKMESFLSQFKEIKQFRSNVSSQNGSIDIYFPKMHQSGSFPYFLKDVLVRKATELGGGAWGVYGFGDGFNNDLEEKAGNTKIRIQGYNYDELYHWAELFRDSLLKEQRIKEVTIDSKINFFKSDYKEYVFDLKKEKLIEANMVPQDLFSQLNPLFARKKNVDNWITQDGIIPVRLSSKQAFDYDIWQLDNFPNQLNDKMYLVGNLASIERYQVPQTIARENQQYILSLQYEYIGASRQNMILLDRKLKTFEKILPIGYSIENGNLDKGGSTTRNNNYWLLLIVVCIIFITTSILFNSLKQPFLIIMLIPISYIGLFLTFYLFHINFDQGGFAAFVILSGITVNAGIYMVNQFNQVKRLHANTSLRIYQKAWNLRIIPIILTLISTIFGFIPFLIGEKEGFWFPLAAGSIGGLLFSLIGLIVFLPTFMGLNTKRGYIKNQTSNNIIS